MPLCKKEIILKNYLKSNIRYDIYIERQGEVMIEINKKYAITIDPYCFVLNEIAKDKNGKKILKQLTYHATLRGLINTMAKREIRVKDHDSFESLEKKLSSVERLIKKSQDISIDEIKQEYLDYKESVDEKVSKMQKGRKSKKVSV